MNKLLGICVFVALVFGIQQANAQAPQYTNITVTHMSIPSTVGAGSPLPISFNITNSGMYAAEETGISINIYGIANASQTYNFAGIAPGQTLSALLYINNETLVPGKYIAYLASWYMINGTKHASGRAFAPFTVAAAPSVSTFPVSLQNLPDVVVTSVPLLFYEPEGSKMLSQIWVLWKGNGAANAGLGIPAQFSNVASLSTPTLHLTQNQSLSSDLLLQAISQQYETTYMVPLNITVQSAQSAKKSSAVRYIQLSVLNDSGNDAQLSEQMMLKNDSSSASAIIEVKSPLAVGMYNSDLRISIPSNTTYSYSSIGAYGARVDVSGSGNMDNIDWAIGNLAPGQTIYLYLNIRDLLNPGALLDQQASLSWTTEAAASNLIRLINSTIPTVYTNYTQQIGINILYTGTAPSNATITLVSASVVTVKNGTRYVKLYPNSELHQNFTVETGMYEGTGLIKMYIEVGGVDAVYRIPVIILSQPFGFVGTVEKLLLQYKYHVLIAIILVCIILIYFNMLKRKPRPYNARRTEQLVNLREQINRGRQRNS